MLARGIERVFGTKPANRQARALLAADAHAFAGYARWQINDRWDAFAGNESLKPYAAESRFFERLLDDSYHWPAPFAASLAFRLYLARRDVFVRTAARAVFKCRKLLAKGGAAAVRAELRALSDSARAFARNLKAGQHAANAMWRRTRDPEQTGQNETLLQRDAQRLEQWQQWLTTVRRQPARVTEATPVCGPWQLQFIVHNLAPAVARVIVEQQEPDGTWREIASRYTIEFRASAARPSSRVRREFTVPVPGRATPLRLRPGGVGQVGISHLALTDGVTVLPEARFRQVRLLGRPAPKRGMPDPTQAGAPVPLRFAP
jgi:hypothetical protein